GRALRDDVGALPVLTTVQHDENAARFEVAEGLSIVIGPARQPHPQHIHRGAEVFDLQADAHAYRRVPTIGADHQVGADLDCTGLSVRLHADDPAALLDEVARFGPHHEVEAAVAPTAVGQKIEEIPLRHEDQKFADSRKPAEIRDRNPGVADLPRKPAYLV